MESHPASPIFHCSHVALAFAADTIAIQITIGIRIAFGAMNFYGRCIYNAKPYVPFRCDIEQVKLDQQNESICVYE